MFPVFCNTRLLTAVVLNNKFYKFIYITLLDNFFFFTNQLAWSAMYCSNSLVSCLMKDLLAKCSKTFELYWLYFRWRRIHAFFFSM